MAQYRVTMVGAGSVGKSALTIQYEIFPVPFIYCTRFIQGRFIERYDPTIEDSYTKNLIVDNVACILDVVDTAGQEEYKALRDTHFKDGDGFIMVYAINSRSSFEFIPKIFTKIMQLRNNQQNFPFVIVGNKKDLEADRVVSTEEGQALAKRWDYEFFESSAKTYYNINEFFVSIIRTINKWRAVHQPPKSKKNTKCIIL